MHTNTIDHIVQGIKTKDLTAEHVVGQALDRIKTSKSNAVVTVNPRALEEARAVDKSATAKGSFLRGVPVLIKDNICTRGLLTTAGSRILDNYLPPEDATLVTCLRRAGAIVLGKTNLDEFGMGSRTEFSVFGATKNPWDPRRSAGGSSGGSAAALVEDLVPVTVGTDTGGSVRQPSAYCGVFGLKPTYGRISRSGLLAYASSFDQAGPMARNVNDLEKAFRAMAGTDPRDATSSAQPVPKTFLNSEFDLKGLHIGVVPHLEESLPKELRDSLFEMKNALQHSGVSLVEVALPPKEVVTAAYYLIAMSEASSNLARYDGVRFGRRSAKEVSSMNEFYAANRSEGFGKEVKRRIILGTFALSKGYADKWYLKANQIKNQIEHETLKLFESVDGILMPSATETAPLLGADTETPEEIYNKDHVTALANLTGLPALNHPLPLGASGLPFGCQLMGNYFSESLLLSMAAQLERQGFTSPMRPGVSL